MTFQSSKDMLIKLDMDGVGDFATLAVLQASRISFNSQAINVTTLDGSSSWRELLVGGGVKSVSISGSGVFRDKDADERARQLFFDGSTPLYQVVTPDFGIIEGLFQITSIEYAGQYAGEKTNKISLASVGEIQFA